MADSQITAPAGAHAADAVRVTPGVAAHLARFPSFLKERAGREPDWMHRLRQAGMARFAAAGFPSTREEAWKDTSLAKLARQTFVAAPQQAPAGIAAAVEALAVEGAHQAVFVNGRFASEYSRLDRLPAGVSVAPLSAVWQQADGALEESLAGSLFQTGHVLTALNEAFMEDGLLIQLSSGQVLQEPLQVLNLVLAGEEPLAVHPRLLILAGRSSQLHLLEQYAGRGRYFMNTVTDLRLAPGSMVAHEKIARECPTSDHVSSLRVHQERNSEFSSVNFSRGSGLVRNDLHVVLSGEGAQCRLSGLTWGQGDGHVDHHTVVDHVRPHGTSWQLYKAVLAGRSRGVFCGRVIVRPGAQKTTASQTNKNLLLSTEALASSIPHLEINADDVQCRHGSAMGQMDESMLFYLQSRGIAAPDARRVLTLAFAAEILDLFRLPELRQKLQGQLLSSGDGWDPPAGGGLS